MRIGIEDVLMPPALALVFLGLGWPYARSVSGGRPLSSVQKKMLLYGFWYVLGMGYLVMTAGALRLPNWTWVASIVTWSLLLVFIAWWRHRRDKLLKEGLSLSIPARTYVSVGLPFLGVLASLIMAAIEWNFVAEGQGHLWQALAWTAALAACIWLAGKNRRVVVVMAFRVFLVLGVIGAIGHPTPAALVAVGVVAVAYFLLERLWPKQTDPPIFDLGALDRNKPD